MNIEQKLKWLFMRRVFKDLEEEREEGVHVTEIVYDCLRRAYYDKLYGSIEIDGENLGTLDEETAITFWIGKKLHEMPVSNVVYDKDSSELVIGWFEHIHEGMVLMHEYPVSYEIGDVKIVGRIDEVVEIDGELIIVDKKSCRSLVKKAYEHHIRQVEYYSALLWKQDNILINKGAIIYIDVANRKVQCFVFDLERNKEAVLNEMVTKAEALQKAITNKEVPEPSPSWLCDYCLWFERCVKDGWKRVKESKWFE